MLIKRNIQTILLINFILLSQLNTFARLNKLNMKLMLMSCAMTQTTQLYSVVLAYLAYIRSIHMFSKVLNY